MGSEMCIRDRVIIATHSDQALQILDNPNAKEKEILGAFPYQENEALLTQTSQYCREKNKPGQAGTTF